MSETTKIAAMYSGRKIFIDVLRLASHGQWAVTPSILIDDWGEPVTKGIYTVTHEPTGLSVGRKFDLRRANALCKKLAQVEFPHRRSTKFKRNKEAMIALICSVKDLEGFNG